MEAFAIYRDYLKAEQYREQQKEHNKLAEADTATIEGYIQFGGGNTVEVEEAREEDLPFGIHDNYEKCYDSPETDYQLSFLERYGYFYKKKIQ